MAADNPRAAWYVYFFFGYPKTEDMTSRFSFRCVRTPQSPTPLVARYRVESDQVLDVATGLRWQRAFSPRALSFEGAGSFCGHLVSAGKRGAKTNWRVPTLVELLTLIDERATAAPAPAAGDDAARGGHGTAMIDRVAFPGTPGAAFWTSSVLANDLKQAWYVRFDQGTGLFGQPTELFAVRCVH